MVWEPEGLHGEYRAQSREERTKSRDATPVPR